MTAAAPQPPWPGRVLVLANPIAGRGLGEALARQLEQRLRNEGYSIRTWLGRPEDLEQTELTGGLESAIVIGGDGTLRAAAERLIRGDILPPLLPVPLGTANLMVRHLGIHWNRSNLEQRVVASLRRHRVLHLDAGRVNGRLMLLVAGVGFDAQIVQELDRIRRGPISLRHYLIASGIALTKFRPTSLRVALDGKEIFVEDQAVAFVGNLAEYGTGFAVLPHARPDDGLLDVCVLPCRSRTELVRLFMLAAAGEHTAVEGAVYGQGKHVRIESAIPAPVQVDGDPAGHTPVEIDLLPIRLPFIVG